ncbi:hypothetical protein [Xylanibacter muris]|uniref:Uncharacterized protein n=1 Tax=Xylanibacter muris TaxID=2736290 RepID=A0ABX2AK85_9BACT|nr:hypothetical protein [Xylanibacter muris]NPD91155.1 hypothetical protein [Xylanibacter muris]
MKKLFLITIALISYLTSIYSQEYNFKGYFLNDEYNVYIRLDLHGEGLAVPGHEIFGNIPGYLAKPNNSFYWLITSKEIKSKNTKKATINLINDYGSEDLEATLTLQNDSTLILTQGNGSTIKVPNKGKWQKLPKQMKFIKQKSK